MRKVVALLAAPDSDTLRSALVFDWDQVKKDRSAEPTLGMKLDAKSKPQGFRMKKAQLPSATRLLS